MNRIHLFLSCAIVVTIAHQSASADFVVVDTVGVDVSGTAYIGPGVLDASSRTWELKPSTGNTFSLAGSTVTMTYGGHSAGSINDTPAGIVLFDQYKFTTGAAFGVVLTGLDPDLIYNVVYYGAQDGFGGRGTTFDLAEPNLPSAQTTGAQTLSFGEGVNYIRYDNLTPQLGDDRIRVLVGVGPPANAVGFINGFEIQALASVPESSSIVLAGFGLLGLIGFGRGCRRRA